MKITRTITFDGKNNEDYHSILSKLQDENAEGNGWHLTKDPLLNRVTAHKVEEVTNFT